ncbi:FecR domain-containing protein [Gimesia sp.]|uniref:FecR domain-containing protein n=1 Tax=Gimesia sp. TaxID=2024833 RepID=UPI003A8E9C4F
MITENSANREDPLPSLVARHFDNQLNERELYQLQSRLKSDPEARVFFIQFSTLQTQLEWVFTDSTTPQEWSHLPAIEKPVRKNWNLIGYITVCACLLTASFLFLYMMHPVAYVFPQPNSEWTSGPVMQEEPVRSGSQRHLIKGEIEIRYKTGSIVNLKAPAFFTVDGDNSVTLDRGKLVADIPEAGQGFRVGTKAGRIVDWGTSFSVSVDKSQNAEIKVYRGKVSVGGDSENPNATELTANQAVQIDSASKRIQHSNYSSSDFIPLIARDYAVNHFSDNVIFQEQLPDQIARGDFQVLEQDGAIFLFPEKRNILLSENLPVSISQPGNYQAEAQIEKATDFIPRGMTVDCYRIYYDPISNNQDMIRVEGEVHFHRPVLGIITTKNRLLETDAVLNPLCASGVCPPIKHQEVEARISEDGGHQDILRLSEDRKSLKIILYTGTKFVDEFRVLVASP